MTRRFLFRAEVAQAERFDHSVGPRDSDAYSAGLFTIDPCAFAIQRLAFHKGVLTVETAPMCFFWFYGNAKVVSRRLAVSQDLFRMAFIAWSMVKREGAGSSTWALRGAWRWTV